MKRILAFLLALAFLAAPALVFSDENPAISSTAVSFSATADVPVDFTWKIDGFKCECERHRR